MLLALYACDPVKSLGRRFFEPPAPTRSVFQRDRDRIVHSTAFRRLVYKTQVFLNHEGDLFRTRLTHSLEVAQLGRSIARQLHLSEDLVEAIALAHDLGHTPFGHAGQDALNACLKTCNPASSGFEHNLQSLRVVDSLEERYPAYNGLNLTFETREGILKHCSKRNAARIEAREPGGIAHRFIEPLSDRLDDSLSDPFTDPSGQNKPLRQPSLEAQLANLADEIAYNAHDIDDGVRSGLLTLHQLEAVELVDQYRQEALQLHPHLQGRRLLFETIRLMLSAQVYDVINATRSALQLAQPASVQAVRQQAGLVQFSAGMAAKSRALKRFLFQNLYRHPQVLAQTETAQQVVRDLFEWYLGDPGQLPAAQIHRFEVSHNPNLPMTVSACAWAPGSAPKAERVVADYIAGMTDRFAAKEHERLTGCAVFTRGCYKSARAT